MASSRNKSSSTGLRFLWIPGRKRRGHDRKGHYDSTSKHIDYNSRNNRHQNQMWSLGGSKGHSSMLKPELSEDKDGIGSLGGLGGGHDSSALTNILPATYIVNASLQEKPDMKLEDEINKSHILDASHNDLNKGPVETSKSGGDIGKIINGNKMKDDVNLIEEITTENGDLTNLNHKTNKNRVNSVESLDSSTPYNDTKSRNKKKNKKKNKLTAQDAIDGNETTIKKDKEEDEAIVKCLYFTLMCCECTIS